MTLEDKKGLYRASFANTLSEIQAPESTWKFILAALAFAIGITTWIYTGMVIYGTWKFTLPVIVYLRDSDWSIFMGSTKIPSDCLSKSVGF